MRAASQHPKAEARFETRVLRLALLVPAPAVAASLYLVLASDLARRPAWWLATGIVVFWVGAAFVLRDRVIRPVQTLANLLGALRQGDFSVRSRGARSDDALGLALLEINTLAETLREQRMGALEATALLRRVMEEIDVAVLSFDEDRRLRLLNRAAERLLAQPAARILGKRADHLDLDHFLSGDAPRTVTANFPGAPGRWELRRTTFRQGGRPHQLVVLSDVSRALREEERQAWQRLIRVLSHEINNSLTPIQSIAGSLADLLADGARPATEENQDLRQGLKVIGARSAALSRFMASYAKLARLPSPEPGPVEVAAWVERAASLESRVPVRVVPGPDVTLEADGDQLDQLLINLVRNAADAAIETGGAVEAGWRLGEGEVEVWVADEGAGIADTANLFVPFFTTKPNGSGIGLALSRQIAEAHGGSLRLENRRDRRGASAVVRLPV